MSTIGTAIRQARKARKWSYVRLAGEAGALPGAPPITELQVRNLERGRNTFKIDDPDEPLPWVLRALGLGLDIVGRGLGLKTQH